MWNTIWYALGIITGIYITSIHFRVRVNGSFNRFVTWVKYVIERNKRVREQERELQSLRGVNNNNLHVKLK